MSKSHIGRPPAVILQAGDREAAATRSKAYRRHWYMGQEQLAVELGTQPSIIAMIERASPFASSRLVAACLALDPAIEPKDDKAKRHRAMRLRVEAEIAAGQAAAEERRKENPGHGWRPLTAEEKAREAEEDKDIPFT